MRSLALTRNQGRIWWTVLQGFGEKEKRFPDPTRSTRGHHEERLYRRRLPFSLQVDEIADDPHLREPYLGELQAQRRCLDDAHAHAFIRTLKRWLRDNDSYDRNAYTIYIKLLAHDLSCHRVT